MNFGRCKILLLLLCATLPMSGCAWWGHKSSSRIVEGDSSTIKYTNPESAGGPIGGDR